MRPRRGAKCHSTLGRVAKEQFVAYCALLKVPFSLRLQWETFDRGGGGVENIRTAKLGVYAIGATLDGTRELSSGGWVSKHRGLSSRGMIGQTHNGVMRMVSHRRRREYSRTRAPDLERSREPKSRGSKSRGSRSMGSKSRGSRSMGSRSKQEAGLVQCRPTHPLRAFRRETDAAGIPAGLWVLNRTVLQRRLRTRSGFQCVVGL